MTTHAESGVTGQVSLRRLARRNSMLSLLLFAVLIGIVYVASLKDREGMQQLEGVYQGQFEIEAFKASLSNIMVPLNDFAMTAEEKNYPVLKQAVSDYQSSYDSLSNNPYLNDKDKEALSKVVGLMGEVMTIANDVVDRKIPASQAPQVTLLAQNLVLAAQKKLAVIVDGLEQRLKQRSEQHQHDADMHLYMLLGFIAFIILLLELLSRGLLKRAEQVSKATSSVAESVGDIIHASEQQSDATEQQSRFMERVIKGLELIADAGDKMTTNITNLEKNSKVATSFAKGGAAEAAESIAGAGNVRTRLEAIPATVKELETRLQQLAAGLDRIQDITEESQLMVLNASIDGADSATAGVTREVQRMAAQTRELVDGIRSDLALASDSARTIAGSGESIQQIDSYLQGFEQTVDVLRRLEGMSLKNAQAASVLVQASERQADRNSKVLQALQHISELLHVSGDKMRANKEASARLSQASESLLNMS